MNSGTCCEWKGKKLVDIVYPSITGSVVAVLFLFQRVKVNARNLVCTSLLLSDHVLFVAQVSISLSTGLSIAIEKPLLMTAPMMVPPHQSQSDTALFSPFLSPKFKTPLCGLSSARSPLVNLLIIWNKPLYFEGFIHVLSIFSFKLLSAHRPLHDDKHYGNHGRRNPGRNQLCHDR